MAAKKYYNKRSALRLALRDRLTVVRNGEELEVQFCGIQAPEKQQKLGIEARNHLKSLIDKGDGSTIYLTPVERDIQGRMIAELFVVMGNKTALFLNSQMVADGYAWHDEKHSSNCPSRQGLTIAERVAKDKRLGGAEVKIGVFISAIAILMSR